MIAAYRDLPLRTRLVATLLLGGGLLATLAGGGLYAAASYTAWEYANSEEGQRASRQVAELDVRPVWLDESGGDTLTPSPPLPGSGEGETMNPSPQRGEGPARSARVRVASATGSPPEDEVAPLAPPEPRAAPGEIQLESAEFRFDDPPEPGARVRLVVDVRNQSDAPTDTLSLAIGNRWFDSYRVVAAVPDVLDDRLGPNSTRHFDFPGLPPQTSGQFELHLVATDEDLRAPEVHLRLPDETPVGQTQPQIFAPRPRPGPARAISIPRLNLQSSVVQTAWEPPPFVVGQIRGTANLSEGNTVLIGHLNGLSGNVFAPLDRLKPGDEVVAVSRGLEYRFVVSEATVLENHEHGPMGKTDTPRLTLMTCTGLWNPFTQDYSHRLWVVAEPEELARETIAANAARATATALAPTATPIPAATPEPTVGLAAATPGPSGDAASTAGPADPTAAAVIRPPRPAEAGLKIRTPAADARVPSKVVVKGSRATPVDPQVHAWLFVRSQVEGSRWYVYPKEIIAKKDGSWEAELVLGGPPNVRHELRLGVVDAATHEWLVRLIKDHPGEPLEELPPGFWDETTLVVTRG